MYNELLIKNSVKGIINRREEKREEAAGASRWKEKNLYISSCAVLAELDKHKPRAGRRRPLWFVYYVPVLKGWRHNAAWRFSIRVITWPLCG
jgi:hypothetical protein